MRSSAALAAVDLHLLDRLPAHERGKQPGQPQDMIQVAVGDQDVVQALETDPGLQDLALGAFAAVDQEAVFIMLDDLRERPRFAEGADAEVPRKMISNKPVVPFPAVCGPI